MKHNSFHKKLNTKELKKVNGGGTSKFLIGTVGSAMSGSVLGPIGFWGVGLVGIATFCDI